VLGCIRCIGKSAQHEHEARYVHCTEDVQRIATSVLVTEGGNYTHYCYGTLLARRWLQARAADPKSSALNVQ
jgi:hypothetical protein